MRQDKFCQINGRNKCFWTWLQRAWMGLLAFHLGVSWTYNSRPRLNCLVSYAFYVWLSSNSFWLWHAKAWLQGCAPSVSVIWNSVFCLVGEVKEFDNVIYLIQKISVIWKRENISGSGKKWSSFVKHLF